MTGEFVIAIVDKSNRRATQKMDKISRSDSPLKYLKLTIKKESLNN
jgi:hypothetical protein